MPNRTPLPILVIALCLATPARAQTNLSHSLFSVAGQPHEGLLDDSELGLAITSGNTDSSSIALKQLASYRWPSETVQAQARYLEASAASVQTAKQWELAGRYERKVAHHQGGFVGQSLEADLFAGYSQRYATDLGLRRTLWSDDTAVAATELGYQYQLENQVTGARDNRQLLRAYVEGSYRFNPYVTGIASLEGLPNLKDSADWLLNSELALQAALGKQFSLKSSYLIRYAHRPPDASVKSTDTALTTALVATF